MAFILHTVARHAERPTSNFTHARGCITRVVHGVVLAVSQSGSRIYNGYDLPFVAIYNMTVQRIFLTCSRRFHSTVQTAMALRYDGRVALVTGAGGGEVVTFSLLMLSFSSDLEYCTYNMCLTAYRSW